MFTRTFSALALLLVAACGQGGAQAGEPSGEAIACASGSGDFSQECRVQRVSGAEGDELVVRHGDGHMRRFTISKDGQELVSADGADAAQVIASPSELAVTVGADRYRFPATLLGHAAGK